MIRLVIPDRHEGERGAGQWKDLQGIRIVLEQLGADWREFRFDGGNVGELAAQIGASAGVVIWYYSFWPEAMEELKRRCPRARVILRTVNAEAFQHWVRASKNWRRFRGLPRDVYGFARLMWRDRRCACAADILAGISAWDNAHYWQRLAGKDKVCFVPYFCPWPHLLPAVRPLPWEQRETDLLCLAGTRDPIGRGHAAGFTALARRPEWSGRRLAASAGLLEAPPDDWPGNVERLGRLDEPWTRLCGTKAVALLSPLGYGSKTTVTDALAAGCHVLVHPRQHERLPPDERALAIPVDPASAADARRAVACLSQPPARLGGDVQREQMNHSVKFWKRVLSGYGTDYDAEDSYA
ncbi:MAG TPA: hypothetical protein P5038_20275 [Candidatus Paceibacterota bacterium]|nr:hypothetical protein [Candidatus Paceibacterota bacterium]